MLRNTVRAGIYAAPAILTIAAVTPVAAATPAPAVCVQPVAFGLDALLMGAGGGATFDVYYTLSNQPTGTFTILGSFTTDRFGFGGTVVPVAFDSSIVTSVKLTYVLAGNSPTVPAATFTSTLIAGLACTPGGPRNTAALVGIVVQEPTAAACQVGPLNQYNEYVDCALINATPNTAYDIYARPNTLSTPVKVATVTTNPQGNVTLFAPVLITTATSTSVVVSAVLAGGSPSAPVFTTTASGASLTTIPCSDFMAVTATATRSYRALGIARH